MLLFSFIVGVLHAKQIMCQVDGGLSSEFEQQQAYYCPQEVLQGGIQQCGKVGTGPFNYTKIFIMAAACPYFCNFYSMLFFILVIVGLNIYLWLIASLHYRAD